VRKKGAIKQEKNGKGRGEKVTVLKRGGILIGSKRCGSSKLSGNNRWAGAFPTI